MPHTLRPHAASVLRQEGAQPQQEPRAQASEKKPQPQHGSTTRNGAIQVAEQELARPGGAGRELPSSSGSALQVAEQELARPGGAEREPPSPNGSALQIAEQELAAQVRGKTPVEQEREPPQGERGREHPRPGRCRGRA